MIFSASTRRTRTNNEDFESDSGVLACESAGAFYKDILAATTIDA
jgi:hypothetical protein